MELHECLRRRRDTRHFTTDSVPEEVLQRALHDAHTAPSVGLSEPWRFVIVESLSVRQRIKEEFDRCRALAEKELAGDRERSLLHKALKLEAITTAPLGIAVFCEPPPKDQYVIGTITKRETLQWSVACAIQNLWLSLTSQGYGAGWVSILDHDYLKRILQVPENWEAMGYLCIGKPGTDYSQQPMLQKVGWKKRSDSPWVRRI